MIKLSPSDSLESTGGESFSVLCPHESRVNMGYCPENAALFRQRVPELTGAQVYLMPTSESQCTFDATDEQIGLIGMLIGIKSQAAENHKPDPQRETIK